ncbi:protein of unknown function [Methylocaldum szegediense]|uniref:Uncharacterized protein n=1 Tax=Methylocaldum szegediense TaxID=73780 RepID=A0ABN8X1P2_9GAMM|nr:protein of unknown function [Methylocaldum szegediense]
MEAMGMKYSLLFHGLDWGEMAQGLLRKVVVSVM